MGSKEHLSFEDYRENISKLIKIAKRVEFTIIREAIKYGIPINPSYSDTES
ncbi:MAG TPA: hypothetical protein VI278_13510 [Nitrososphaeraceae archaeon]